MEFVHELEAIEQAARGNDRIAALAAAAKRCPDLVKIIKLTTDPLVTFNVKKLPEPMLRVASITYDEMLETLHDLRTRVLTGKAAQLRIAAVLGACDDLQRKWVQRILLRDLRLDMGVAAVNAAIPGLIKKHVVAKGISIQDAKPKDFVGTWVKQPKLDGFRHEARLFVDGHVELISPSGHDVTHEHPEIVDDLTALNAKLNSEGRRVNETYHLDGEICALNENGDVDFQLMQQRGNATNKVFYLFDAAHDMEWVNPKLQYSLRYAFASLLVDIASTPLIRITPNLAFTDGVDRMAAIAEAQDIAANGGEGLMFRRWDAPVEMKKGKRLLKAKGYEDAEFLVLDIFDGEPGTKREGQCGGLILELPDGKTCRCGSGMTDKWAKAWKENPKLIVGQRPTIRFMGWTNDGLLRLPRIKGVRPATDLTE